MNLQINIRKAFVLVLIISISISTYAQVAKNNLDNNSLPFVGAQVFIESGQTKEDIDIWFRLLKENNLTACRIRMFESYMRDENYNWNFELFDNAFKAAEKYGIKVWATLYPVTGENINIGGDKFPTDYDKQVSIARYIEKTVNHFKSYKSLNGWVLMNEPGVRGQIPNTEFTNYKQKEWGKDKNYPPFDSKGYPILMNFKSEEFLLDYTSWYLEWISTEIKKYDQSHDLHVNNHDLFVNCSEYNFPKWRNFLSSLGGSAHPSWHFTYFEREKYPVAMSADCEMLLSGAGNLPWFMTEIQGGNNTYSGFAPMCPTSNEIKQWLWIVFGSQGKGGIFWSLNPRTSGVEAGEWALIDFQRKPTDRLLAAGEVSKTIQNNSDVFVSAKKADSHITILYTRESLWAEKQMILWDANFEARRKGSVMKSSLAYFEALSEMGISPNLKSIDEFDFSKLDFINETIILSHQICLPSIYIGSLEQFVKKGGKLIVDGLSAFFDENMHNSMLTGFNYQNLFGGNVSEFKFEQDIFNLSVGSQNYYAHMWKGLVSIYRGESILDSFNEKVGIRHQFGSGESVWIPSLIGLGSRIKNDFSPLWNLLSKEASASISNQIARFETPHKNMLMKCLQSGNKIVTIIINNNKDAKKINLIFNKDISIQKVIFSNSKKVILGKSIVVDPEETVVVLWE